MDQIFDRVTAALATLRVGAAVFRGTGPTGRRQKRLRTRGWRLRARISLAPRCRIDFMVGDIGVEMWQARKKAAARAACGAVEPDMRIAAGLPRG